MDLIIIIAFVALAMLVSNIAAVKKRQHVNMEEVNDIEDTEDTEEGAEDTGHAETPLNSQPSQLEILLKQWGAPTAQHPNAKGQGDDRHSESETGDCEPRQHGRQSETHTGQPVAARKPSRANNVKRSAAKAKTGVIGSIDEIANSRDNSNRNTHEPLEDFDLRRAVLYSEILKPKFDNNQD
ncbi:MAG: hypothetical protein K2F95_03305 [Alistipes sp.]|nr:hypothetical protein [Alistipes sp.]